MRCVGCGRSRREAQGGRECAPARGTPLAPAPKQLCARAHQRGERRQSKASRVLRPLGVPPILASGLGRPLRLFLLVGRLPRRTGPRRKRARCSGHPALIDVGVTQHGWFIEGFGFDDDF